MARPKIWFDSIAVSAGTKPFEWRYETQAFIATFRTDLIVIGSQVETVNLQLC